MYEIPNRPQTITRNRVKMQFLYAWKVRYFFFQVHISQENALAHKIRLSYWQNIGQRRHFSRMEHQPIAKNQECSARSNR